LPFYFPSCGITCQARPRILVTQEAEIRRTAIQSQPGQIVCETLSQKHHITQKRAGGVAQGIGLDSKPNAAKK
jgi:hypothetical protein